jgi:flagellar hook assembly protein FlgD
LRQNYPNPFNPTTTVVFDVPFEGHLSLTVYDVLGRAVAVLAEGDFSPGVHSVTWNGRTSAGTDAAGGVYFVRMQSSHGFTAARKMLLLK